MALSTGLLLSPTTIIYNDHREAQKQVVQDHQT